MKLTKKKLEAFLQAQLMTLIALDLVENNVDLNPKAREASANAKTIIGMTLDQLIKDYPKCERWLEPMTKALETPRG